MQERGKREAREKEEGLTLSTTILTAMYPELDRLLPICDLRGCYKGVARVVQGCHKGVTRVLQGC
jgi:hypothetical protein